MSTADPRVMIPADVPAVASRKAFGETLKLLGDTNPKVVALDADLSKSTMSAAFGEAHPERFFEMGIQEANMISTAAGLALSGYTPFCCSFAAFITGRFDQIKMSVAYSQVKVCSRSLSLWSWISAAINRLTSPRVNCNQMR
jgi:transketolase C-terminal domain/subunit